MKINDSDDNDELVINMNTIDSNDDDYVNINKKSNDWDDDNIYIIYILS